MNELSFFEEKLKRLKRAKTTIENKGSKNDTFRNVSLLMEGALGNVIGI